MGLLVISKNLSFTLLSAFLTHFKRKREKTMADIMILHIRFAYSGSRAELSPDQDIVLTDRGPRI